MVKYLEIDRIHYFYKIYYKEIGLIIINESHLYITHKNITNTFIISPYPDPSAVADIHTTSLFVLVSLAVIEISTLTSSGADELTSATIVTFNSELAVTGHLTPWK